MLTAELDTSSAALEVGYESPSQAIAAFPSIDAISSSSTAGGDVVEV